MTWKKKHVCCVYNAILNIGIAQVIKIISISKLKYVHFSVIMYLFIWSNAYCEEDFAL